MIIIYDHKSTEDLLEVLQPYIQNCTVQYILWPPSEDYDIETHAHAHLSEFIKGNLKDCRSTTQYTQVPCQLAAFNDALRLSRGMKARWLAKFDVDEFFYPPASSPTQKRLRKPVKELLQALESYDILNFIGAVYGTSGHKAYRYRGPSDLYASLNVETHTRHAPTGESPESPYGWLRLAHKAFGNPAIMNDAGIHDFNSQVLREPESRHTRKAKELEMSPDNNILRMVHYQYLSELESNAKSALNNNEHVAFDRKQDAYFNLVEDTGIQYLIPSLAQRLTSTLSTVLPEHSDDYDKELLHMHNTTASPRVCITVLSYKRVGYCRQAVDRIIKYMHQFEPGINYELVLLGNGSEEAHIRQLTRDLPFDSYYSRKRHTDSPYAMESLYLGQCRAPYVLTLEEDRDGKI